MFSKLIGSLQKWSGPLALFLVLTGGVAYAANTIGSSDVIDNSLRSIDLKNGAGVKGVDVVDDSLTGDDIIESSLGEVPSATLGGIGRWQSHSGQGCDVSTQLYTCAFTTITLPQATRVLLIGTAKVHDSAFSAQGKCLLATNLGDIGDSATTFVVDNGANEHISLVAITTQGPGAVDFAIRCMETSGDAVIYDAAIAAVALSPD
jgi:hypothetical protein